MTTRSPRRSNVWRAALPMAPSVAENRCGAVSVVAAGSGTPTLKRPPAISKRTAASSGRGRAARHAAMRAAMAGSGAPWPTVSCVETSRLSGTHRSDVQAR
jgi:hypothetical protein